MTTSTQVSKDAIVDLIRVKDEFDSIIDSLELMSDKEFMDSYQKSKEQIRNRKFVDWGDL